MTFLQLNFFNNFNNTNLQSFCTPFSCFSFPNFNFQPLFNAPLFNFSNFLPFQNFKYFQQPMFFQYENNFSFNNTNVWNQSGLNFNFNSNFDSFNYSVTPSKKKIESSAEEIESNTLSAAELKKIKNECYSSQTGFSLENAKIDKLYKAMGLDKKGLNKQVFKRAIEGYNNLSDKGNGHLGIFDTTQGSSKERYYLLDLNNLKLVGQTIIKEGSGNMANIKTANKGGSGATLSGFEKVGESYKSSKTWERGIRLRGLEKGINDTALARCCVAHYTKYNTTLGCKGISPVKENGVVNHKKSIEKVEKFFPKGAIIFTYPKDERYWSMSKLYS